MAAPVPTVCSLSLSQVAIVNASFTLSDSVKLLARGKGGDERGFREATSLAQRGETGWNYRSSPVTSEGPAR